jgi:hypothetical protein
MQDLLKDQGKITSKAKIDRTELNTLLNLAYYFPEKRICKLKIGDVYVGSNILPFIEFDINKSPRKTEASLESILNSHIKYLIQKKHPVDQDSPLFPGYFDNNNNYSVDRKLKRHIFDFAKYKNFDSIIKYLRRDQYQQLVQAGNHPRRAIQIIAESTGKSPRAIALSLGVPFVSDPSIKQGRKLKKSDKISMDFISHILKIKMFDENEAYKIIEIGFKIFERTLKGESINNMKYILIKHIHSCFSEIEKKFLQPSFNGHNNQIKEKCSNSFDLKLLNDEIITDMVNGLFLYIRQIRGMFLDEELEKK